MIKDFLKKNILIADGAIGTYYLNLKPNCDYRVEEANIYDPETVLKIHKEYVDSGSKLIRTNTFSANTISLHITRDILKEIIFSGCDLAIKATVNKQVFVTCNIGPIPEILDDGSQIPRKDILEEYKFIVDCFIQKGIVIFNFETFSSPEYLNEIIDYIRTSIKDVFIMVQFAITKSGYSRTGIFIEELLSEIKNVDVLGFNCGSGPTHLLNNIKKIGKFNYSLSVYPNAGYPEIINQRTVFNSSPDYFAGVVIEGIKSGVKIIGGCCGTTPEYIKRIFVGLKGEIKKYIPDTTVPINKQGPNIKCKDLIIAVELDPPSKPDLSKMINSAKELKDLGVDFITVADSPSGRMRLNPITVASRIKREVEIDVMPHICCRDRNLIALKSDILAAHTENIRKILIITGDPIPQEERDIVKKVFNCNSVTLMKQVSEFNNSILKEFPYTIGGALNLSSKNLDVQINKMENKIKAGATLFLTQPIYDAKSIDFLLNIKKSSDVKILAGIMPLVTYKNAQFLNNEFPGISIPNNIINRFNPQMSRDEAEEVGIEISVESVNSLKHGVDGFYFITPFFRTGMIKKIIDRTQIRIEI